MGDQEYFKHIQKDFKKNAQTCPLNSELNSGISEKTIRKIKESINELSECTEDRIKEIVSILSKIVQ